LDARILQLQNKIRHLAGMVDVPVDDPIAQLGLTDAIRYVIRHAGRTVAPVDVRDELLKRYCDPEDYSNLLASVHNETVGTCRRDHVRRHQSGMDRRTPHSPHWFCPLQSTLSKELILPLPNFYFLFPFVCSIFCKNVCDA
jgi:hypothetical protein